MKRRIASFLIFGLAFAATLTAPAFAGPEPVEKTVTLTLKEAEVKKVLSDLYFIRAYVNQTNLPNLDVKDITARLDSAGVLLYKQSAAQLAEQKPQPPKK